VPCSLRPKSSVCDEGTALAPVVQQPHDQLLELVAAGMAERLDFVLQAVSSPAASALWAGSTAADRAPALLTKAQGVKR